MHDRVQQSAIPVSRYSFTSDEVEQVMPPPHSVSVRVTQKLKMDLDGIIDSLRDRDDVIDSLAVFFVRHIITVFQNVFKFWEWVKL